MHGSPPASPSCPYGVGVRLSRGYPGQPGHLLNCAEVAFAAKYLRVVRRFDPDANFQPLRSNGLGGDSGQQPENGPDFPANSTKTVIRNSVKNDPIETEFFSLISA